MTQECRNRDITITPHRGRILVRFDDTVIVETGKALDLKEEGYPVVHYIPRLEVVADILLPSGHRTTCPFKGIASYHHLGLNGVIAENAVWFYRDPCPLVEGIRDHVAFWGDRVRFEYL